MPTSGVPESIALPSPLSLKVTPLGRLPLRVMELTRGDASVVISKVPALPTVNVVLSVLVKAIPAA